MIYGRVQKEHLRLQRKLQELQAKIDDFPEGKLVCARNGDGYSWYNSNGHEKVYIPRKNRALAEQLAVKKYYTLQKAAWEKEKTALEFYLRHHSDFPDETVQKLWEHPAYRELLSPQFLPQAEQLKAWAQAPYERNPHYPEGLLHKTASGDLVRSKSEAMIAFLLYTHQIPFRYECALHLEEITIYPDFTIRHPRTGQWFYWEHFGRMDDPAYAKSTGMKLQQYISHGIIPSIQLIATYETLDAPLTTETIETMIQQYFL